MPAQVQVTRASTRLIGGRGRAIRPQQQEAKIYRLAIVTLVGRVTADEK